MKEFSKSLQDIYQQIYETVNNLRSIKDNIKDTVTRNRMDEEMHKILDLRQLLGKEIEKKNIEFIRSHPDSYASLDAFLPPFKLELLPLHDFRQLYDSFSARSKNTEKAKWVDNEIRKEENTVIGAVAPDFSTPDLEGRTIKLSDFRGSYVFLDFWAMWCPHCLESFPYMEKLYKKYALKGLQFIAVSCDVQEEDWRSGAKKFGAQWHNVAFISDYQNLYQDIVDYNDIAHKYLYRGIPKFFILDPDGKIIYRWYGYGNETEKEINQSLEKIFPTGSK